MIKINTLISYLLIFSLALGNLTYSTPSIADEIDDPPSCQNPPVIPPGSDPSMTCTCTAEAPPQGGFCCEGLELNQAGRCDEQVPHDPAAPTQSCTSNNSCPSHTACLPQSAEDMFSHVWPGLTEYSEERESRRELFQGFLEDPLRANGRDCNKDSECESFNCVDQRCAEKRVCRYLREGESLQSGVNCGLGLEIDSESVTCKTTYNPVNHPGLFEYDFENELYQMDQTNSCEIRYKPKLMELMQFGIIAVRSIRSMEWFFATLDENKAQRCPTTIGSLKNIGRSMYDGRKPILLNFSESLNSVEADFRTLITASEKYSNEEVISGKVEVPSSVVDLHVGTTAEEAISDKDLATRLTSGYDNLILSIRRNDAFAEYESSMNELLSNTLNTYRERNLRPEDLSCLDANPRYEVRPVLRWKTKNWRGDQKWYWQYEVTNSSGNLNIINRNEVVEGLALIAGESRLIPEEENQISPPQTLATTHYLLDPVPFSGLTLGGPDKQLRRESGFLGLPIFGGFRDLRKAKFITGGGSSSYSSMYDQVGRGLNEYYRGLNPNTKPGFIYEPELQTPDDKFLTDANGNIIRDDMGNPIKKPIVMARDCIENPNQIRYNYIPDEQNVSFATINKVLLESDRGSVDNITFYEFNRKIGKTVKLQEKRMCTDFYDFLRRVQGEGFARFLAFAHSPEPLYTLRRENNLRRLMFAKLENDFLNLTTYYDVLVRIREHQNSCYQNILNRLTESGILNSDAGGITPGSYTTSSHSRGSGSTNDNRSLQNARKPFVPKFSIGNFKGIDGKSKMDSLGLIKDNSGKSTGLRSSSNKNLAFLRDKINKARKKGLAQGQDLKSKNKKYQSLLSKIGKGGASFLGANQGGNRKLYTANLNPAKLGSDLKGDGKIETKSVGVNKNFDQFGVGSANYGKSSGTNDLKEEGSVKSQSLSDIERERLLKEAKRNRKDFLGNDNLGLFEKVSNAYIRNMDRVLNNKKAIGR